MSLLTNLKPFARRLDPRRGSDQAFTSVEPGGPAVRAGWGEEPPPRKGFFTDTSICIGCKACEVACKEWNGVPQDGIFELLGSSYDNTGALGASTWRHVEFIEQRKPLGGQTTGVTIGVPETAVGAGVQLPDSGAGSFGATASSFGSVGSFDTIPGPVSGPDHSGIDLFGSLKPEPVRQPEPVKAGTPMVDLGMPSFDLPSASPDAGERTEFRWLMASNVCKHCTNAGCLDVCPTGALFRTEFGTVVVQDDVCNGCGYCVAGCPFGVIDRRIGDKNQPKDAIANKNAGIAQKCTLCYDRLGEGLTPACAQACPTQSIQFGDVDELRERANVRLADLQAAGVAGAQLYAEDPDGGVGGAGAFFLLLDEPEVYGFPPDPIVTTADLPRMWKNAGFAALGLAAAVTTAFVGGRR
ncbi:4Fe-4S dicluster domain-containing protein [Microlunatus antarcticus]|uniref:Formate dehydrogenase iron-sulfur subunit n=1 Tax=Microlunatus antarcticus TaxID=53388 RepID=A0A7W5JTI3_9ACTN|nr:4Fe-4S dicluster domain-containing protein [Microlunatus antarcticus]MBB3325781.1 formate dehydrogenase iron-sulfur subunit [Microlunatus antarcticus]